MPHAGRRIAGGVDHQVDPVVAKNCLDVFRDPGPAGALRGIRIRGRVALGRPADARQILARPRRVQIRDRGNVDAGRADRLGQEHRGELAAADDPDPDRIVPRLAFEQQAVEVHAARSADPDIGVVRQSSGSASMGLKSRWAIHPGRLKRRMWFSTWHSDR